MHDGNPWLKPIFCEGCGHFPVDRKMVSYCVRRVVPVGAWEFIQAVTVNHRTTEQTTVGADYQRLK